MSKSRSRGLDLNVTNESKRSRFERQDRNEMEGSSSDLLMEGSSTVVDSVKDADFTIKVGDVSYPVHQHIVTLSSEYFRGMLADNTKERQVGFVEMKEIDSQMNESAEFLQLTELTKQCVDVLEENLKSGNCITVLKLARAYNCYELAETASDIFKKEFKVENYEDFCNLDKDGIKQHVNDLDMEIAWNGIINWIKLDVENRSCDIVELIQMLIRKRFLSSGFLSSVWSEPLFQNSEFCRNLLFKRLFLDNEALKREINVENCLIIDKISEEFEFLHKDTKEVIFDFMEINFFQIANKYEFRSLPKETVLRLFRNVESELCDETTLLNTALTWMKNNPNKKDIFIELLKSIRCGQMPNNLVKSMNVKAEPILREIPNLYEIFLDHNGTQQNEKSHIAILYPNGKIYAWNILCKTWYQLPDLPQGLDIDGAILFSFRNRLCILIREKNVYSRYKKFFYLGKNETRWIPRASTNDWYGWNTVVTTDDKIYIVVENIMSCYDLDTNTWDDTLPGCDLEGKIFGGFCKKKGILARNTEFARWYSLQSCTWGRKHKAAKISEHAVMASKDRKLCIVGYQEEKLTEGWELEVTPISINDKSYLLVVNGRLILLTSKVFYAYDELCNVWNKFSDLPRYQHAATFAAVEDLNPVSVCSFKGNLRYATTLK